mmetsp:Transcript_28773/g.48604  ORF Transcript_28773/g.48604 Transcript_28773/m.48604 type:complete len:83 (-) Transcript_28773:416-664(-)
MKRAAAREKAAAREEVVAREEVAAMGRAAARVFNAMSTVRVRLEPRKGNLRKVDNISASYVIFFFFLYSQYLRVGLPGQLAP